MAIIDNTLAAQVETFNPATPLAQAAQIQNAQIQQQANQFKLQQAELGAEARGLQAYVNSPDFPQKWAETTDRLAQKGVLAPQAAAQWRNQPSPLMLKSIIAQTEDPTLQFRKTEADRAQANTDREFKATQGYRAQTLDVQRRAADRADDPNKLGEVYDETTGQPRKAIINTKDGSYKPIGGAKQATTLSMPDDTADFLAERVLAGDTRALIGLGRGAQGAENLTKIQGIVAQKARDRGLDATDILAKASEAAGVTAQQRTFGTQTAKMAINATEAEGAIELGRTASSAVPRTNWVPVNKAIQAYQSGTSDPALAKFGAANLAIVNTYARAISPTGVPTVHDKEHAEKLLSTATGPEAYSAVLDQMNQEIKIAHGAAPKAKKELEDIRKGRTTEGGGATKLSPGDRFQQLMKSGKTKQEAYSTMAKEGY